VFRFDALLESGEVGRHLLLRLASHDEWDKDLAEAMTLEVHRHRDGQP
jgi:hypothetical protein